MCAGCAGSRDKVTGVLEHHHILPLALDQPSFLLGRPLGGGGEHAPVAKATRTQMGGLTLVLAFSQDPLTPSRSPP